MHASTWNLPERIGAILAELRTKTGLKQSDVAAALSVHTSRISRLETGDVNAEPEEVRKYLDCLDTDESERLLSVLGMRWQHVPQPSYAHPQLDAVKTAEIYLTKLDAFLEEPGVPRTLLGQATMHRESLQRTADFLSSLEHTVAYVGDIGAGKTTAICLQTDLVLPGFDRNGVQNVALDTGSGRTTVCEVRIRYGNICGLIVTPQPDNEIYKLVGEFCAGIWETNQPRQSGGEREDNKGVSGEIDRTLRNMSGLTRLPRKDEAGKNIRLDRAAELARECSTLEDFRSAFASRLKLWERDTREIWYEGSFGPAAMEWVKKIFTEINNGRHPEFSLPERIDVIMPIELFPRVPYRIEVVDTKGVDQTAIRPDLKTHLDDPRAVVVLASKFNSAPDRPIQDLLKHLLATGTERALRQKVLMLVLARTEEALATKDEATGYVVETQEEGYELKQAQIEDAIRRDGMSGVPIQFFNAKTDEPKSLSAAILTRIETMRSSQARRVDEIVTAVNQMFDNKQAVHALEAQREVNKTLLTFVVQHRKLSHPRTTPRVYESLLKTIRNSYPRTVWATTRRGGSWSNLDVYHCLGNGVATVAKMRSRPSFEALREHIRNRLGDRDLSPTHGFLKELRTLVDEWEENFLFEARHIGTEIFRPSLEKAGTLWGSCEDIYGTGRGFRQEVEDQLTHWFEDDHQEHLHKTLEQRIQVAWRDNVLNPLCSVCEDSVDATTAAE